MKKRILYRVKRPNGGVNITPNKPTDGTPYTETYRLIADDGNALTDGINNYSCIDTDESDKYSEIVIVSEATEQDYINSLTEMGVELDG